MNSSCGKNIVIFGRRIGGPGEEWLFSELANHLARANKVTLLGCEGKNSRRTWLHENLQLIVMKHDSKNRYLRLLRLILANIYFFLYIRKQNPNIIIVSSSLSFYSLCIFLLRNLTKNVSKLHIIVWDIYPLHLQRTREDQSPLFYKLYFCLERYVYRSADKITAPSRDYFRVLKAYFGASGSFNSIPIWTWGPKSENLQNSSLNPLAIVYGGTFDSARNIGSVLVSLASTQLDFQFYLYGGGIDYERYKEKYCSDQRFLFMGKRTREQYVRQLVNYDVGIVVTDVNVSMPSFPSKTLDYAGCGLAIVALIRNNPSFSRNINVRYKCGFAVRYRLDLILAIEKMINDRELLFEKKRNSEKMYDSHSPHKIVDGLI